MAFRAPDGQYPAFPNDQPAPPAPDAAPSQDSAAPAVDPNAVPDPNAPVPNGSDTMVAPPIPDATAPGLPSAVTNITDQIDPGVIDQTLTESNNTLPTAPALGGGLVQQSTQTLTKAATRTRAAADKAAAALKTAQDKIETLTNDAENSRLFKKWRLNRQIAEETKKLKKLQTAADQTEKSAARAERRLTLRTGGSAPEAAVSEAASAGASEPTATAAASPETAAAPSLERDPATPRIEPAPSTSYSGRGLVGGTKFDAAEAARAELNAARTASVDHLDHIIELAERSQQLEGARQATMAQYGAERDAARGAATDATAAEKLAAQRAANAARLSERFDTVSSAPLPGDAPTENLNVFQRTIRGIRGVRVRNLFDQTVRADDLASTAQAESVAKGLVATDLAEQAAITQAGIPSERHASLRARTRFARSMHEFGEHDARLRDLHAQAIEAHESLAPKSRVQTTVAKPIDAAGVGAEAGSGADKVTKAEQVAKPGGVIGRFFEAIADNPVVRFAGRILAPLAPIARFAGRVAEPLVGFTAGLQIGHTLGTDRLGESIGRSLGGEPGAQIGRNIGKWAPAVVLGGAVAVAGFFAAIPTAIVVGLASCVSVDAVMAHDVWQKVVPRVKSAVRSDYAAHGSHNTIGAAARSLFVAGRTVASMAWHGVQQVVAHPMKAMGYVWDAFGKGLSFQPLNIDYWFPPKAPAAPPPKAVATAPAAPVHRSAPPRTQRVARQRAPAPSIQPAATPTPSPTLGATAAARGGVLPQMGAPAKGGDGDEEGDDADHASSGSGMEGLFAGGSSGTLALDAATTTKVDQLAPQLRGADTIDISGRSIAPAQEQAVAARLKQDGVTTPITFDGKGAPLDGEVLSVTHITMPSATAVATAPTPMTAVPASAALSDKFNLSSPVSDNLTTFNLLGDSAPGGIVSLNNTSLTASDFSLDNGAFTNGRRASLNLNSTLTTSLDGRNEFLGQDIASLTTNLGGVDANRGLPQTSLSGRDWNNLKLANTAIPEASVGTPAAAPATTAAPTKLASGKPLKQFAINGMSG